MGKKLSLQIDGKELSKDELKKRFEELNVLCFDGELGRCGFSLFSRNISHLGWYQDRNDKNGKPKDKIWFGTSVKWTNELLEAVMVHEMILWNTERE